MKRFPVILAPALLGSLLMLGGCATTGPSTAPLPPDRDCQEVYTVAPGNYIIDIAGGSMVVLDPAVQDFPLFCSPEEARAGLKTAMDNGALPAGEYACVCYRGPYSRLVGAWRALREFAAHSGREIVSAPLELYHIDAHDTDRPSEYVTEVQVQTKILKKA